MITVEQTVQTVGHKRTYEAIREFPYRMEDSIPDITESIVKRYEGVPSWIAAPSMAAEMASQPPHYSIPPDLSAGLSELQKLVPFTVPAGRYIAHWAAEEIIDLRRGVKNLEDGYEVLAKLRHELEPGPVGPNIPRKGPIQLMAWAAWKIKELVDKLKGLDSRVNELLEVVRKLSRI